MPKESKYTKHIALRALSFIDKVLTEDNELAARRLTDLSKQHNLNQRLLCQCGIFETCKGTLFLVAFEFCSGTHELFEELVGILRGVGLRNVLHAFVGLVRSLLSMFLLSVHRMIPRDKIFGLYETNLYSGSI